MSSGYYHNVFILCVYFVMALILNEAKVIQITNSSAIISPETDTSTKNTSIYRPEEVPDARPELCSQPMDAGSCKSRQYRYYYDSKAKKCVEFVYGGCAGNNNRFFTKVDCENTCYREEDDHSGKRSHGGLDCTLQMEVLGKCRLTSNISRIASCGPVPFSSDDENECLANGCCWHHSYKICYNYVAQSLKNERCTILRSDANGFLGVATFRTFSHFRDGWVGYLTFSKPITGDFCMVKDDTFPQRVVIGEKFMGNRGIVLQGTRTLYAGQMNHILFLGSFGNTVLDRNSCEEEPSLKGRLDSD